MKLTYRHWFVIALMVLINILLFGCLILAIAGKIIVG
jgi:hypothetical protein